jgi:NAD(P)-dependent dehydrogenase (short-subunit alcohol dehydrogenase family)
VPYCAAKGGVELMTKALALDWAEKRVRVNAIAPGYFETDLTAGMRDNPALSDRLLAQTPMHRFGTLNDAGGAAVFLASGASAYMTGQSLLIDGGWTAA